MARGRRRSYAELEAEFQRVELERTATVTALQNYVNQEGHISVRRGCYRARIIGARRADGGVVVVTFDPGGQSPHSAAYFTGDWITEQTEHLRNLAIKGDRVQEDFRNLVYEVSRMYHAALSGETDPLEVR